MKRYAVAVLSLLAFSTPAHAGFFDDDAPQPCANGAGASFEVVFSAPGALSPSIVREITTAKKSVRVAAREFTSKPVSEALVKASRSGADLKVVVNKKTNDGVDSAARFLFTMSTNPHQTKSDDALHSDYIVIDEKDVILGNIAPFVDDVVEKQNNGYVLIIHNAPDLAKKYLANWQTLWDVSEAMKK